jgi:hypothetical protein
MYALYTETYVSVYRRINDGFMTSVPPTRGYRLLSEMTTRCRVTCLTNAVKETPVPDFRRRNYVSGCGENKTK